MIAADVFPLRLLPDADPGAPRVLFDVQFDDGVADGLHVLQLGDEPRLQALGADEQVSLDETGLRLRGGVVVVRLVEIPAEHRARADAWIEQHDDFRSGARVGAFHCIPVLPVDAGFDGSRCTGEERVISGAGTVASLADWLARHFSEIEGSTAGRFVPGTAEAGMAIVRGHVPWSRNARYAAIGWTSAGGPVAVRALKVEGELVREYLQAQLAGSDGPEVADGARVEARLGGECRDAILVGPRSRVVLPLEVDVDGASRITFGVAPRPEASGGSMRYRVVLRTTSGDVVLDEAELDAPSTAYPSFIDREARWPRDLRDPPRAVVFESTGDTPLLFAQPILRGPSRASGPNLLLLSIDTLRADHLGCYGYDRPTSPFLDELAARMVRFFDCAAAAPFTLPAHASMLTGLHPPRHQATDVTRRLDARSVAYLPAILADAGYATAAFVGGGYVSEDFGFQVGFDRFLATDPMRPTEGVGLSVFGREGNPIGVDDVAAWIEGRGEEPWFAFVHTYAAHDYFAPKEVFAPFDSGAKGEWRAPFARLPRPRRGQSPAPAPDDVRHLVDLYDATIRYVDGEVRRLFERLEEGGHLQDTVVVITSDHGEEFLDHGDVGHSVSLYQEQVHVPLLIGGPGIEPAVVRESFPQVDLLPTLLELLRLPAVSGLDGVSRAPWLHAGFQSSSPTIVFHEVATEESRRSSLRIGRWKVILSHLGDEVLFPGPERQLFDLRDDPRERTDLSEREPRRAGQLEKALRRMKERLERSAVMPRDADVSAEVLEHLRQIGYLGDGR